jgi:hypothetical protein
LLLAHLLQCYRLYQLYHYYRLSAHLLHKQTQQQQYHDFIHFSSSTTTTISSSSSSIVQVCASAPPHTALSLVLSDMLCNKVSKKVRPYTQLQLVWVRA